MDHVNGTDPGAPSNRAQCAAPDPHVMPGKIKISAVVSSRYGGSRAVGSAQEPVSCASRPASWDNRRSGIDTVRIDSGEVVRLRSTGAQSVPQPGWVVVLTGGDSDEGFTWTLYGIPPRT
jgi:hypothetical protein